METAEIERICDYITDLEDGLVEGHNDIVALRVQLPELYRIIKTLMDETFRTKDKKRKTFLAFLELRARKCMQHIESRLAVRN